MNERYKLMSLEQYSCIISTELLDNHKYPKLYEMVVKHMMHDPCRVLNSKNVCLHDGSYKNYYSCPLNTANL